MKDSSSDCNSRIQPYEAVTTLTPEQFLRRFLRALADQAPPEGFILTPAMRKDVEAMMAEPPPWDVDVPLDLLVGTPFPKLVITGNWSPAFDAVAEVLTRRLQAHSVICTGAGHNIAAVGDALNEHLVGPVAGITMRARMQAASYGRTSGVGPGRPPTVR